MKNTGYYFFILLFLTGCSIFKKDEPSPENDAENIEIIETNQEVLEEIEEDIGDMPIFEEPTKEEISSETLSAEAFYPIKKTLEDLRSDVNKLKAQIVQYETTVSVPSFNPEVLKMIKTPHLEHRITLSNGTVISGTILKENTDRMTVETQLGQLTLDKGTIENVEDAAIPAPDIELLNDIYYKYITWFTQYIYIHRAAHMVRMIYCIGRFFL